MIILKATSIELLEYKLAAWLDGYEENTCMGVDIWPYAGRLVYKVQVVL